MTKSLYSLRDAILASAKEGNQVDLATLLENRSKEATCYTENALQLACIKSHVACAKLLVRFGVDVNCSPWLGEERPRPLECAAKSLSFEICELLLENGAVLPGGWFRDHGAGPLHVACDRNHTKLAKLFLDHGADVNRKDDSGFTPLHFAVRPQGQLGYWRDPRSIDPLREETAMLEIVELLIERGARIDAKNSWGDAPIHFLLNFTEIHPLYRKGPYPLYKYNMIRLLELLLSKGADPNCRNRDGCTPRRMVFKGSKADRILQRFGGKRRPIFG